MRRGSRGVTMALRAAPRPRSAQRRTGASRLPPSATATHSDAHVSDCDAQRRTGASRLPTSAIATQERFAPCHVRASRGVTAAIRAAHGGALRRPTPALRAFPRPRLRRKGASRHATSALRLPTSAIVTHNDAWALGALPRPRLRARALRAMPRPRFAPPYARASRGVATALNA